LLLTIDDKRGAPAKKTPNPRNGKKKGVTQTNEAKATADADADTSLAIVPVKKPTKGKKKASPLQVSASHSVPEDEPDQIVYRPATTDNYFHLVQLLDQNGGVFKFLDDDDPGSSLDWINFPSGAIYTPRPGPPSAKAKHRLERLAQFVAHTILTIAHDDKITREKAWELTGLLKTETRGPNMYNAFSHWRAGQLTTANNGIPGKCLL
jgi:hypothetical protein